MTDVVRPAGLGDARAIAEAHVGGWQEGYRGLIEQAHLDALSAEQREPRWRRAVEQGDAILVHEREGSVDGFVCYGPCRDEDLPEAAGEVYALYVLPRTWRSGVGSRLLRAAVDDLAHRDAATGPHASTHALAARPVVLWALEGNTRARGFYEAQGWRTDGARKEDHRPAIGAVPAVTLTEVRYLLTLGVR